MIRRFSLRDFKGHRDTQLDLGRLTMLVGDNASGKTSVLEALALQSALGHDPGPTLVDCNDLLRRGSGGPLKLATACFNASGTSNFVFALDVPPKVPGNPSWNLSVEGLLEARKIQSRTWDGAAGEDFSWNTAWDLVSSFLGPAGLYRLRAERIAAAAYSGDPKATIEQDGTNAAVALAAMKLGDDEAFQRVEDALRALIPSVERLRIRPATVRRARPQGTDEVVGSKLFFDFRGAPGIPAHGASQGTLLVLALLAVLYGPRRPNLILLDDFDHALHPRAQMELVRMIKHLLTLDDFGEVQVLATTHSPYMLDELEPSEVQAFALRDDGTVASKRLSEHPDAERTRGSLKTGQLWSLDPERDWVLRD